MNIGKDNYILAACNRWSLIISLFFCGLFRGGGGGGGWGGGHVRNYWLGKSERPRRREVDKLIEELDIMLLQ